MAAEGAVFLCTYKKKSLPDYFHLRNSEALPNTTIPSRVDFKIGKNVL
jgi:hypothetical protein